MSAYDPGELSRREELARLVTEMPDRYRALVLMATWCALRFGELTELDRHDVQLADDDASGWLHARRAVAWSTPHTQVVTTPKSNAGIRDVAIPPHLIPMLRAHIALYAMLGPRRAGVPNTESKHMHHGSLYKVFKRARGAIGRPTFAPRPPPHGRHHGCSSWRDHARTHGSPRSLDSAGSPDLPKHAAADRQADLAVRLSAMAPGELR